MSEAVAHPNIALVKYWGKQAKPGNLPAMPNLSITIDTLTTTTRIRAAERDEFHLDGAPTEDAKLERFLSESRARYALPPVRIDSSNNFPTGAGLASSASGFAALVCALNDFAGLELDDEALSDWARTGSASAARSISGGYVALVPPLWSAQQVATRDHWPLSVVVAIVSTQRKEIGSSEGMEISRLTSPFYETWIKQSSDDFADASEAIAKKDFEALAKVAEASCLKMHSLMLTSTPTLAYWQGATLECMRSIQKMRAEGTPVFFTIDAGPQIKAVCAPEASDAVATALRDIEGVQETLVCGLGDGVRLTSSR